MLKFTFEGESAMVDVAKLPLHWGVAIQKATGWRMKAFGEAVAEGDMVGLMALGWVIVKFRMGRPDLTMEQIESGEVELDVSMFEDVPDEELPTQPEQSAT